MVNGRDVPVFSILDESPFFKELSIKEREVLIGDLYKQYPHLAPSSGHDQEVGYEASWMNQGFNL